MKIKYENLVNGNLCLPPSSSLHYYRYSSEVFDMAFGQMLYCGCCLLQVYPLINYVVLYYMHLFSIVPRSEGR